MNIIRTQDALLVARLNEEVQNLHHAIEPKLFKKFDQEAMAHFLEKLLKQDNHFAYIAYLEEKPVAYMILSIAYHEETAMNYSYTDLKIDQINVMKAYRGKGLGKALVDFAKAEAETLKVSRIVMNYWTENKNSGDFFRGQGFESYNERLYY